MREEILNIEKCLSKYVKIIFSQTSKIIVSNESLFWEVLYFIGVIVDKEKRETMKRLIIVKNQNELKTQIQTVMSKTLDQANVDNSSQMKKTFQNYLEKLRDERKVK